MRKRWFALVSALAAGCAFGVMQLGQTEADGDAFADPYLDPYAFTMAHAHAASGEEETEAEKGVAMTLEWPEGSPSAGTPAKLALRIQDGGGGPLAEYDIVHEKPLHLIAISENLEHFLHVHPEHVGEGRFELPGMTFPTGGAYKLFADLKPAGMNELTRSEVVAVAGDAPEAKQLTPSESWTADIEGMRVTLDFGGHLMAGMQTEMTFTFADARSGKPVKDLELYLGAVGHVVAVDEAMDEFIHVHPLNWASSGPQAVFGVTFPEPGLYKLWGQFQRNGELLLVPFAIEVP